MEPDERRPGVLDRRAGRELDEDLARTGLLPLHREEANTHAQAAARRVPAPGDSRRLRLAHPAAPR